MEKGQGNSLLSKLMLLASVVTVFLSTPYLLAPFLAAGGVLTAPAGSKLRRGAWFVLAITVVLCGYVWLHGPIQAVTTSTVS